MSCLGRLGPARPCYGIEFAAIKARQEPGATTAASIENRPPFLDHELVELAFRVSSGMKIRGLCGKWILKRIAHQHLPANIVNRRKVGFKVPLDEWFRVGLKDYMNDLLLGPDSFVSSYFDRKTISSMITSHLKHRRNEERRLWTLMGLEVWAKVFLNPCIRSIPARVPQTVTR